VSDAKYRSLREPIPPTVYSPVVSGFDGDFILHLRTRGDPAAAIAPVREALRRLAPGLPFVEVRTLREEVETSLWQERLLAWLSALFGGFAALLAGIGLYGALDFAVKARRREVGVRVALGATPSRVVRLLSRDLRPLDSASSLRGSSFGPRGAWIRSPFHCSGCLACHRVSAVAGRSHRSRVGFAARMKRCIAFVSGCLRPAALFGCSFF
jgi:hypothetical protein